MHYACMVVGPEPDRQLEPFSENARVPRFKEFLDVQEIRLMAKHFSLPEADLHALARKMPEWAEDEAGIEEGRLFRWSTSNPQSKYDWYERGGRFAGYLRLEHPAQPTGEGCWEPDQRIASIRRAKQTWRCNQSCRIRLRRYLSAGVWHECPITSDAAELEKWRQQFTSLFNQVPPDALLTIMDLHS